MSVLLLRCSLAHEDSIQMVRSATAVRIRVSFSFYGERVTHRYELRNEVFNSWNLSAQIQESVFTESLQLSEAASLQLGYSLEDDGLYLCYNGLYGGKILTRRLFVSEDSMAKVALFFDETADERQELSTPSFGL